MPVPFSFPAAVLSTQAVSTRMVSPGIGQGGSRMDGPGFDLRILLIRSQGVARQLRGDRFRFLFAA